MTASHGLHRPHGEYPSPMSASRLPVNSFRFSSFISETLEQEGR